MPNGNEYTGKKLAFGSQRYGEWISDENVVFLTKQEARSLQIKARLSGKTLSLQHGYDGELWCYKHEMDYINQK